MEPNIYYRTEAEKFGEELRRRRKRRNGVTLARIGLFVALGWGVWLIVSGTSGAWLLEIALVALFIGLGIADRNLSRQIRTFEELIRCCHTELNYLLGDLTGLATGNEFDEPLHPYSRDLDILGEDSLFQRLDRSATLGGRRNMARWLLALCRSEPEIEERQEAVAELAGKPGWRLRFRVAGKLSQAAGADMTGLESSLKQVDLFGSRLGKTLCYGLNIITIGSWLTAISGSGSYAIAIWLSLAQLLIVGLYTKRINLIHRQLTDFVKALEGYLGMIRLLEAEPFSARRLKLIKDRLFGGGGNALKGFRELVRLLGSFDQRANLLVTIFFNGLYMRDLHLVMNLARWRGKYGMRIAEWTEAVEEADALCGMANFRFNHPDYTVPEMTGDVLFDGHELGHPMLGVSGAVTNDFGVKHLRELYIVTGANMAGKSTFLRTVGVNLVLALSGNVVFASRLRCTPMALFTSMRTTDNLSKGTSYFHAELLRLQQLVETARSEEKLFIILDEMLKGTNSHDKLNGSLRFLEKLLEYPVSGLVATHDLALGELADRYPEHFRNACFEIGHTADDIVYDYKLHPGVSRNMNASILLEKMKLI